MKNILASILILFCSTSYADDVLNTGGVFNKGLYVCDGAGANCVRAKQVNNAGGITDNGDGSVLFLGGATNVGFGTAGRHIVYTGTATAGPSASVFESSGNVGIGTTAPQSALVIGGTGQIAVPDGSASVPAYTWDGAKNTGFYRATTSVGLTIAGTDALIFSRVGANGRISSASANTIDLYSAANGGHITLTPSSGGNVGIGSAAPQYKLTIVGDNNVDPIMLDKGTGTTGIKFTFDGTNYVSFIRTFESSTLAANHMDFGVSQGNNTTESEKMRIMGDGNVGIGTTTPQGSLVVLPGNVGIGSLAPVANLDVFTAGSGDIVHFTRSGFPPFMVGASGNDVKFGIDTVNAAALRLNTNGTTKMIVQSDGNVGVGTTTPQGGFVVNNGRVGIGTWAPQASIEVGGANPVIRATGSGSADLQLYVGPNRKFYVTGQGSSTDINSSSTNPLNFGTNSATNMTILNGGNVGIGTTTPMGGLVVMNGNIGIGTWAPTAHISLYSADPTAVFNINDNNPNSGCDSSTKVLLHLDGTNGSTTFTDSACGSSAHTFTANGNAQLSTTASNIKFGTAGLLLDGTGDYVTSADSADWQFGGGTGAFTVDSWAKKTSSGSYQYVITQRTDGNNQMQFSVNNDGSATWAVTSGGVDVIRINDIPASTIPNSTYFHWALIRGWAGDTTKWAVTINGVQVGSVATSSGTYPDFTGALHIGRNSGDTGADFNGAMDEVRISTGAKWTSNFTPPTFAYGAGGSIPKIILQEGGATKATILTDGTDADQFKINAGSGVTAITVDQSANVGIGTTMVNATGKLVVIGGNVGIGTTTPNGSLIVLPGNVGIGTITPASKLTIGASTLMQRITTTNTACSTVCGQMGCFFGEDTGVLGTMTDCADASSDVCFCSK